ncbi:hypothetical protein ACLJYM_06270 [Rhizobium giardinii]|uniref:hypothetical protein n=1 Tax=Rhizobium giardinii TaxID=56731 RepID=UPI0039DF747B
MAYELQFTFDELQIPSFGIGMLLYGTAYLQSTGDGEFFVQSIQLDGGAWLTPTREGSTLEAKLYREIAAVLYDETTPYGGKAAEDWAIEMADLRGPDPDRAYEEHRDSFLHAAE